MAEGSWILNLWKDDMHLELMRDRSSAISLPAEAVEYSSARIWYCKYKTLAPIGSLANLETLVIAGFPDETLDILLNLKKLKYLSIVDLPKVSSLMALGRLEELEGLSLATLPSWDSSGRVTLVDNLDPIARLPKLLNLELLGVCPSSRSLESIFDCKNLKSARFSQYNSVAVRDFYERTGIDNTPMPDPIFF